jgi:transposase-like protein
MRELDFAADQSLQKAWKEIQWNFSEDLETELEGQISHYLNRVLRIEADRQLRADPYERTLERLDYRAGYRRRSLVTTKGLVELQVPKARSTSLRFSVFERYRRLWKRVDRMLCEIFLAGCSTRRTGEVLELLLGTRVSAQTVSRAVQELTPLAERFHQRPLEDHYRVLLLDGVTQSIRTATGKAKKKVALVAYGITHTGHRELIDFRITPSESAAAWHGFLMTLYHRGLEGDGLKIIVSDGGRGLISALEYLYPDVDHQRCWAHKLRNVADKVKKADRKRVLAGARRIYQARHRRAATKAFQRWRDRWIGVYRSAVACVERDLESLLTFFDYPEEMRVMLRTTNAIERSFREVRRRTRPIGCFNNVPSCDRIIYAICIYQNAKWENAPLKEFAHNS